MFVFVYACAHVCESILMLLLVGTLYHQHRVYIYVRTVVVFVYACAHVCERRMDRERERKKEIPPVDGDR